MGYDTISVKPETKKSLSKKKGVLRYTWEEMMQEFDDLLSEYGIKKSSDLENMKEIIVKNNGNGEDE